MEAAIIPTIPSADANIVYPTVNHGKQVQYEKNLAASVI